MKKGPLTFFVVGLGFPDYNAGLGVAELLRSILCIKGNLQVKEQFVAQKR